MQGAILQAILDLIVRFDAQGTCLNLISGGDIRLRGTAQEVLHQSICSVLPANIAEQQMQFIRLALSS
ncbi:MAG: hypothetical protein ACUVRV_12700 [Cyanobacteriota bacterium]